VVFRPGILLSGFWVLVLYQGTTFSRAVKMGRELGFTPVWRILQEIVVRNNSEPCKPVFRRNGGQHDEKAQTLELRTLWSLYGPTRRALYQNIRAVTQKTRAFRTFLLGFHPGFCRFDRLSR
jgi:hypothetical protein